MYLCTTKFRAINIFKKKKTRTYLIRIFPVLPGQENFSDEDDCPIQTVLLTSMELTVHKGPDPRYLILADFNIVASITSTCPIRIFSVLWGPANSSDKSCYLFQVHKMMMG